MNQTASTASGSVIVQIAGDGNVVALDRPHLTLTRPRGIARRVRTDPETGKPSVIDVIRAGTRSLDLVGRDTEMADLQAWLHTRSAVSVRVLVGSAGVGKTRLAIEMIEQAAQEGWRAGFLARAELRRFRGQQNLTDWGWNTPVLAAVDYASASARHLHAWLTELAHNPVWDDDHSACERPLRLLLLERHADRRSGWWEEVLGRGNQGAVVEQLADPAEPVVLAPIDSVADRRAILNSTLDRLDSRLTLPAPGDDPDFDHRLAELTWTGLPVMLMLAAATAVQTGFGHVLALGSDRLAFQLAETEMDRILKVMLELGLPAHLAPLVKHITALVMLRQGLDPGTALRVIERESAALGYQIPGGPAALRDLLVQALPDGSGGVSAIEPPIILEAILLTVWRDIDDETLRAIGRAYADDPTAVRETVIHTCQDYLVRGYDQPRHWLLRVYADTTALDALIALSDSMPHHTLQLRAIRARVLNDVVAKARHLAISSPPTRVILASALNNLATCLSTLGQHANALTAIREAIPIYRKFAAVHPDMLRPKLAMSLMNMSAFLSTLGHKEDALVASREAVAIYRDLTSAHSDSQCSDFADALNNLSLHLSELGRPDDAQSSIVEAMDIRRSLANKNPAFRPALAMPLVNMSGRLSVLGRRQEALSAIQEAVKLYRSLDASQPDAYRRELGLALSNLSQALSALGRPQEALVVIQEAETILRPLADDLPDAFLPDLGTILNNLSCELIRLGRHDDARSSSREAVDIRRNLAQTKPAAYQADLAVSLNNLSIVLSALGEGDGALSTAQESLVIRRGLAAERPDIFLPDLAISLNTLSNRLAEHGRHDEALDAIIEAVEIRRDLTARRPTTYRHDLAESLNFLSIRLSERGQRDEAHAASLEAARTLREQFLELPNAFKRLMGAICMNYLDRCKEAGVQPDVALFDSIIARLNNGQEQPDKST